MSRTIKRGYSFGLEKSRYLELRYFCLQYNLKKQIVQKHQFLQFAASGESVCGYSYGGYESGGESRMARMKDDINVIERAAREAAGGLSEYILKSVTEDLGYNYLGLVPCGERQFYEYKRAFFKALDRLR